VFSANSCAESRKASVSVAASQGTGTRMRSYLFPKHDLIGLCLVHAVTASILILAPTNQIASASTLLKEQVAETRPVGEPVMAIVALREQQITVYDANGWILRAPVSSGQKGRETPAGIFSVLQKEAEHYSNMYDDAYMPHMQRLTWSGIALHGGPLPGYPASHGCIRMPYEFAGRLFDATRLGMRVIVAPANVAPVAIEHPALFQPKDDRRAAMASAAAAEAEAAARKADQARSVAGMAYRESSLAMTTVRRAEILKLKAEAQLAAADRAVAAASEPESKAQAEATRVKAAAQVSDIDAQLAAAKVELQPKLDAVVAAREAASAAEAARQIAADAARKATRELEPISVFISRKAQRLYIRQSFQPLLDVPVTIDDPDRPIGTHIFTAVERTSAGLKWTAVSLSDGRLESNTLEARTTTGGRNFGASSADPSSAKAALGRIAIPQDTLDRIGELVSSRSSVIISDEALSSETGKGTEFVALLSGEPQGGIKHRSPGRQFEVRYERQPYWRSSPAYSTWWR